MPTMSGVKEMDFRKGESSKISHFFQQAQHFGDLDLDEEHRLIDELRCFYDKISFKDFVDKFIECLKASLIHPEEVPSVEAILNFAAQFVAVINSSGVDDDETCPFLKEILEFVCANHGCDNHLVRSRICLFVDKLLCKLGNEVVIDEKLYNKLVESMLERMKDKMPGIRVRAISAVYRLQDPFDANCPVVKALSFHLSMDPSVEARRAILRKLAVAAHTLPTIVERIYDVKDFVRKDAFLVLSKCSMSRFTIKQRQMLLYSGLKDRDERVSKCVEKVLLPLWFDHAKNNFVTMLKFLDVETSTETSFLVLQILFKSTSTNTIMDQVKLNLDEDKLIPLDKLSPENAFFWRCAVHFFHNLDDEALEVDKDTMLQSVLPELTPLTNYIRTYFLRDSEDEKKLEFWEHKQRLFILLQLLQLCNVYDLSDELGRCQLKQLCTDLLLSPQVKKDAVPVIVDVFSRILPNIDHFLDSLVEIIMDLKEPFKEDENTDVSEEETDEEKKENNEIVKISPEVLAKCLTIIVEFLQNKNVTVFNPCLRSLVTTFVCPALEAQDTTSRVLALHALSNSCLLDVDLAKQYFLLFCFQVPNDDMCLVALKGIFDLLLFYGLGTFNMRDQIDDPEEKKKDDEPERKKRKLKGAMVEENSFVSNSGEANISSMDTTSDHSDQSANLVTLLMSLLDSSSTDIRNVTVEGLCKLIIGGRITSVNLLSKLMIMWFSPISEEDYMLRQQLGTFFNVYASSFAGSHYMFQQAFLPTLKTLYDAPMDSPLHEIDPDDVAKLLINLILVRMNKEKGPNPHNSLALAICKEILNTYGANLGNVPVLVRSLLPLQLSYDEPEFRENFEHLCRQVFELLEDANNKILAKYMQKVIYRIEAAEVKDGTQQSDIMNTELPSETTASNMNTAKDSPNATESNTNMDAVCSEGDETQDSSAKITVKKSGFKKTAAKSSVHLSDAENMDSSGIEDFDSQAFERDDDTNFDGDNSSVERQKSENKKGSVAAIAASDQEEYSLTRRNLRRKREIEELKVQKTANTRVAMKSPDRSRIDKEELSGKLCPKSSEMRKSARKKKNVSQTPHKNSRAQQSNSKKSIQEEGNSTATSDSDGGDDEDSDEVSPARKRMNKSYLKSSKRSVKAEVVVRSTRRRVTGPSSEETPSKKARHSTKKGASDEYSKQPKNENVGTSSIKSGLRRKLVLHSKPDNKQTVSESNKATPRKLIEVENISKKGKEGNKRKVEGTFIENSPNLKRQPDRKHKESLESSSRNTRSSRPVPNLPSSPSRNQARQAEKSPMKPTLPKQHSKKPEEPTDPKYKISEEPQSPKQLESKKSLRQLEILEEISRKSPRAHTPSKNTPSKNENRPDKSALKTKVSYASSPQQSPSKVKVSKNPSPQQSPAKMEVSKDTIPQQSPSKSNATNYTNFTREQSSRRTSVGLPGVSPSKQKIETVGTPELKKSTSKSIDVSKDHSDSVKSKGKNPRKSLRIALHRLDTPVLRHNRKSSNRRSRSASFTPDQKRVQARSRSSVENSPRLRGTPSNNEKLQNADLSLSSVVTPKVTPLSPKKEKAPQERMSFTENSESKVNRLSSNSSSAEYTEKKNTSKISSPVSAAELGPRQSRSSRKKDITSLKSPVSESIGSRQRSNQRHSELKAQGSARLSFPEKKSEEKLTPSPEKKVKTPADSPNTKNDSTRKSKSPVKITSPPLKNVVSSPEGNSKRRRFVSPDERSPNLRVNRLVDGRNRIERKNGSPSELKTDFNERRSARTNLSSPEKSPSPRMNNASGKSSPGLAPMKNPISGKKKDELESASSKEKKQTANSLSSPVKEEKRLTPGSEKSLPRTLRKTVKQSVPDNSRRSQSVLRKSIRGSSQPVKKTFSLPKKSLASSKTIIAQRRQSLNKPTSSGKKSLSAKYTPNSSRTSTSRNSPSFNQVKSATKKNLPSPKRVSPSPQKSSAEKSQNKRSMKSSIPVRKLNTKSNQSGKKGSTTSFTTTKVVTKPNFFAGKTMSVLARNKLAGRKLVSSRSLTMRKRASIEQPAAAKRSITEKTKSDQRKLSTQKSGTASSTSKKTTKERSHSSDKQVLSGSKAAIETRSRHSSSVRVRKTPSKLTY